MKQSYKRGLETIYDLFIHDLRSILFLEQRLEDELGDIAEDVSEEQLREEMINHRDQTSDHAQRLQQIFEEIDETPQIHNRAYFRGIFQEFNQLKNNTQESEIVDITAFNTAIMIERIEITIYEGLLRLEEDLDIGDETRNLLEKNRKEEEQALKRFRGMSENSWLNQMKKNLMS
ncbi:DUF892 family protein [Nanohaloarchaea archaeon H01]|nr:DUF892 family protein [Nanohaloarchaea archaeon H01]